ITSYILSDEFWITKQKNGYILTDTQEGAQITDYEKEPFKLPNYDVNFTLKESINDKLPAYDKNEE
ncbi:1900_t:CDS:2, partial [Funneliformis geosporum]